MDKKKRIIPCLCMTCGVRNDFTHPSGFCQNGHDNWLEYRDVKQKNVIFRKAVYQSNVTEAEFTEKFFDSDNTFIDQSKKATSSFEQDAFDLDTDSLDYIEDEYIDAIVENYGVEKLRASTNSKPAN